ncbi:hypothetical protein QBC35DRAFT_114552 [Podospora australis]|uniref:Uncharacterized protein n=1 Tax=Podospora australis TaxID=1536484 RepID=A0AAN7AEX0_9PEZI|nr:hypothetical protein QBC35DRAFT_114552 [Podospora australis]
MFLLCCSFDVFLAVFLREMGLDVFFLGMGKRYRGRARQDSGLDQIPVMMVDKTTADYLLLFFFLDSDKSFLFWCWSFLLFGLTLDGSWYGLIRYDVSFMFCPRPRRLDG